MNEAEIRAEAKKVAAASCEAYDPNAPQESVEDHGDEQMPDDLPF